MPQLTPNQTRYLTADAGNFEENKHPRADNGKFGSGGGGASKGGGKTRAQRGIKNTAQKSSEPDKGGKGSSSGVSHVSDPKTRKAVINAAKKRDPEHRGNESVRYNPKNKKYIINYVTKSGEKKMTAFHAHEIEHEKSKPSKTWI